MADKKMPIATGKNAGQAGQIGEGSYEATRDYQKSINTYLKDADVPADARAAQPADEAEAHELRRAEEEGKSHSKAKGA
jgi:hypothetical protein